MINYSKIKRYLIYLFVFIPPIFTLLIEPISLGPLVITPERIVLFIGVFLLLFMKPKLLFDKWAYLLILYTFYHIATLSIAGNFDQIGRTQIINYFLFFSFLLIIRNTNFTLKQAYLFYDILGFIAIYSAIISFYQFFYEESFYRPIEETSLTAFSDFSRVRSIYPGEQLYYASSIMVIIFLDLILRKPSKRYFLYLGSATIVGILFFSRTVLIIISISYAITLFKHFKRTQSIVKYIYLILILLPWMASEISISQFKQTDIYQERLDPESGIGRVIGLKVGLRLILEKPILGHSSYAGELPSFKHDPLVTYHQRKSLHVGYIDVFVIGGIVGFLLFNLWLFYLYRKTVLINRLLNNASIIIMIPITHLLINLTFNSIDWFRVWGFVIGIIHIYIHEKLVIGNIINDRSILPF